MNTKALEIFENELNKAIDVAGENWQENKNTVANSAARSAHNLGYHWDDYPQTWEKACENTIWSR